jgi:hypothetical protein
MRMLYTLARLLREDLDESYEEAENVYKRPKAATTTRSIRITLNGTVYYHVHNIDVECHQKYIK